MTMMTPRQRMLTAIRNQQPDRVPCAPDISNMIPARLTRRPFWDIYYHNTPPLWQAYLDAVDYFGIDGWFIYGDASMQYAHPSQVERTTLSHTDERWVVAERIITPAGEMTAETTFYRADPPTPTGKPVKDLRADWEKVRYLFQAPISCDPEPSRVQRKMLGERGVYGIGVGAPGFHQWVNLVVGSMETLAALYYDDPDLIEALRQLHEQATLKRTEMVLDLRPDFILLGESGAITLQSPTIARQLSLPTWQKVTRMASEAGVPTMLHCCGREAALVKMCAEETDLDCINPLEVPPMGDCDLAAIKQTYGQRLSLMGNLHTTDVMLRGTPETVELAAKKAIDDAGAGGGFILSSGDQCGRDTPDENIRKMVEVCATYGQYK
jgi:uroporphyrinogen decarboxylase